MKVLPPRALPPLKAESGGGDEIKYLPVRITKEGQILLASNQPVLQRPPSNSVLPNLPAQSPPVAPTMVETQLPTINKDFDGVKDQYARL